MLLIDFSQVAIATAMVFSEDFKKGKDVDTMHRIMRHTVLSSILKYKYTHTKKYGELVIACDGWHNWRKDEFANYKIKRKKNREESPLDWDNVFDAIGKLRQDLEKLFPWRVIHVERAEGDDIVAVLTKFVVKTRCVQDGLCEIQEPVLIISADGDFCQLHELGDVRQWSPLAKKFLEKAEPDFLFEKIIRGDAGDGIPSVLCPDDWFVDGHTHRAPPITAKVIKRFKDGLDLTDEEKARFQRNSRLISFEEIPLSVQRDILIKYKHTTPSTDLNGVYEYLASNGASQLVDRIQEFKV